MSKPKEPEVIVVKRAKPLPLQKLYRTKKFKQEWAEFEETFATGKDIGRREGLREGARLERTVPKREQPVQQRKDIKIELPKRRLRGWWRCAGHGDQWYRGEEMKIPNVVYVTIEGEKGEEFLMVYASLEDAPEGTVVAFKKTEELEVRTVTEIKKRGTKTWFNPSMSATVAAVSAADSLILPGNRF